MAAEDILKDLPRTEDSRRLVLQWLDKSMDGQDNRPSEEEILADTESGSIASGSERPSNENGSTASRGGPPLGRHPYEAGPLPLILGRQPYEADPGRSTTTRRRNGRQPNMADHPEKVSTYRIISEPGHNFLC